MNILWMTAQNVYIISDINILSELEVNGASEYMPGPYDHHHSSFRYTRNADAKMNSYRPLVRTKTHSIAIVEHMFTIQTKILFATCFSARQAAHTITYHGNYTKECLLFT
jgi:hypothetical protein